MLREPVEARRPPGHPETVIPKKEKEEVGVGFVGLTRAERESLTYEVVSERARLLLTRLVRSSTRAGSGNVQIILQNKAINIANNVLGLPIYKLEAEDGDYYYPEEHAWHNAELELLMRRP